MCFGITKAWSIRCAGMEWKVGSSVCRRCDTILDVDFSFQIDAPHAVWSVLCCDDLSHSIHSG